jgi:hypothetical protein
MGSLPETHCLYSFSNGSSFIVLSILNSPWSIEIVILLCGVTGQGFTVYFVRIAPLCKMDLSGTENVKMKMYLRRVNAMEYNVTSKILNYLVPGPASSNVIFQASADSFILFPVV